MLRVFFAGLLVAITSLANAASSEKVHHEWDFYRQLLIEPTCGTADFEQCNKALMTWRFDFFCAFDPSNGKQQTCLRNVAFCLLDGCKIVKPNKMLACAWSRAVLLAGDPQIDDRDLEQEVIACAPLTGAGKEAAKAQAERILKIIEQVDMR